MTTYRYVSLSRVVKIEERYEHVHKSGFGADEDHVKQSTGWWVVTDGPSPISMQAGPEKPPFEAGCVCRIVVEVVS